MASSGTCTDAAVTAKLKYTLALLKQYNDNSAPSLTEAQVNRIWDAQREMHRRACGGGK